MNREKLFVILAAVCIFAIALFMIGGVVQDIDYHTGLTDPSLTEKNALQNNKADYERLQIRKSVGEKLQLVGAVLALIGFISITVFSLRVSHKNAEEAEKIYKRGI